jgi:AraC family transcriptional regulator of adaptative response/methylated-DNA-[protein]-cysteine methyltransferase
MPPFDTVFALEPARPLPAPDADRLAAVRRRDPAADGAFVYSVRTTGVYCRPSCAARPARVENIAFHDTPTAARAAGFRPCLRCRPDEPAREVREAAVVATACRLIEEAETAPDLARLASGVGLSPHHFHRLFKKVTGVTPKAYGDAHRARRVRDGLAAGASVTEALYDAGFNSSGRFYAAADGLLGMKPSDYREGGVDATIRYAVGDSSLGAVLVAATVTGVCAILLGDVAQDLVADLHVRFPKAALIAADLTFDATVAAVVRSVERPDLGVNLPLDIRGTAFQQRVWQALRAIPAGETRSYGQVAATLGQPGAHRAVARACAGNALAVAIPCHRVVRGDGDLSGYRWGVARKRTLLARERPA